MYKIRLMISIFQGWPRKIPGSYTLEAGFLICQCTFQYTSCILCVTGGILGGTWKVCIRNFTVVVEFPLVQATCQYTVCILGESWDTEGMCTDLVYLMNNADPWFLAVIKFVFRTLNGRVFRSVRCKECSAAEFF